MCKEHTKDSDQFWGSEGGGDDDNNNNKNNSHSPISSATHVMKYV